MNVGFLILNLGVRGSVRRVVELSNRLVQRGHAATVYAGDGAPCAWLPMLAETRPQEQAAEDELDALFYFSEPKHLALMREAKAARKFLYVLGFNEREIDWLGGVLTGDKVPRGDPRLRTLYQSLREFETITNCDTLTDWLSSIGFPAATVPGGIDTDLFRPRRNKIGFSVLAGGAKRAIEGTQEILLAFDQVKEAEPRAELMLYAGKGLPQEELATLYSSADVFLDAQWYGGWNNPVVEAMACRTAVICTDIWGNRGLAVDGETALIVPVGGIGEMAAAVLRLFEDGTLRTRLAEAGYQHVQRFTWDAAADALERVLAPCCSPSCVSTGGCQCGHS